MMTYSQQATQQAPRNRQCNVIWFNPPFSQNVKTNIERNSLKLIEKHFPLHHRLHRIFNRNTVKVSCSCTNNIKSFITKHNASIIRENQQQQGDSDDNCNCRTKPTCPLQKQCMTKDIVYKATVSTSNSNNTKHYIGMTASTFKERHRNHIKSFQHKKYANNTELLKYIWELKENKQDFRIDWSILKRAIPYRRGSNRCNLYLEEKFLILNEKTRIHY